MLTQTTRIACLVLCFGLLFGFGISSIAGVLQRLSMTFALDASGQEWLVSTLIVASFFGAIFASPLSLKLGRKPTMWIAITLALMGYAALLFATSYSSLLLIRIVLGLSVGLSSVVVPMYAAESTPAAQRGAVVSLFQLAITGGILLAYTVALLFIDTWSWQSILAIGLVPALVAGVLLVTLPESQTWLTTREKYVESPPPIQVAIQPGTDRIEPLTKNSIFAVLALCGGLFVLQNLSGIDGIIYYAPHIFQTLGFAPGTASLAATFGLGLVNFLSTLVALRLVDSAGRRALLIWGSGAMAIGMVMVIAASIILQEGAYWSDLQAWSGWVGLLGLSLFIMAFAVSLGPLPYVMMSELFPTAIRETGIAVASSVSWLFNALIAFTFLSAIEQLGLTWSMTFFMIVCVLSLVISVLYVPETRRVSLEKIENNVMRGQALRRLGE
ncbi:sugar porter family MFS transporter [Zwartia sp.]|uniref:sugar porter family MFS transporter n=1 Tax=Zwartia sp. TaxID=2978004 RepID=UPI003BB1FF5C